MRPLSKGLGKTGNSLDLPLKSLKLTEIEKIFDLKRNTTPVFSVPEDELLAVPKRLSKFPQLFLLRQH